MVISTGGDLLAFGYAVPAPWVRTAAAAELGALMVVLEPPRVITDCMSILSAAATGSACVTAPNKPLSQLWARIATILDADVSVLTTHGHLTWMRAHGGVTTIGRAYRSDGRSVSAADWRANRLADALAKAAVGIVPECVVAAKVLKTAEDLARPVGGRLFF